MGSNRPILIKHQRSLNSILCIGNMFFYCYHLVNRISYRLAQSKPNKQPPLKLYYCNVVCLRWVCPQLYFEPLVWLESIFTKTRENVNLTILILKFRVQHLRASNQLWPTIFVTKIIFCKDIFILQGIILVEFQFFALEKIRPDTGKKISSKK
jgi:hypothetical protein